MTRNLLNNNGYSYPTTQSLKRLILEDGTAAAPSIDSVNNPGNGLYYESNGNVSISAGSTKRMRVGTTEVQIDIPEYTAAGTAAAPSRSYTSDTNTGTYSAGADSFGIAAGGNNIVTVNTTNVTAAQPVLVPAGTSAAPALSFSGDTDTGIYSTSANTLQFSAGNTNALNISSGAVTALLPYVAPVGSVTNCGFQFTGDPNCGFYHIAADKLGVAANGNLLMTLGNYNSLSQTIGISAGLFFAQTAVTSTPYTILDSDIIVTAKSGASVITLPTGNSYVGRVLIIANFSGGSITLNASGSDAFAPGAGTSLSWAAGTARLLIATQWTSGVLNWNYWTPT